MVERPELAAPFGDNPALENGAFYRGWRLWLIQGLTLPDGSGRHTAYAARAAEEARQIRTALTASPTGMVTSYPGRTWPCDNVVAMAAVAAVEGRQQPAWAASVQRFADPATGLLPHEVDTAGRPLEGPRGSSQTIIQTFWPRVTTDGSYDSYTAAFVTRELGLVGVREHPHGDGSPGDVDSGPLVAGVSLRASAVGLAAARANGDARLADTLDREADLLGLPLDWHGTRSYALGLLPVGDAFVAWARSIPRPAIIASSHSPSPLWGWTASGGAVLLVVGLWLGQRRPRHRP